MAARIAQVSLFAVALIIGLLLVGQLRSQARPIELSMSCRIPPSCEKLNAVLPFELYRKKPCCAGDATACPKKENCGVRTWTPPTSSGVKLVFLDCTLSSAML